MRLKIICALFAASLLIFAGSTAAQNRAGSDPPQPPPAQSQEQPQASDFGAHGREQMGPGARGQVVIGQRRRLEGVEEHNQNWAGPLRIFSKMEAELDNPMVRMALGLTDQQADSLRKLVVNTEIITIQTGASTAVDAIQLKEILRADHPDRAAVMAKGDAISQSASALVHHYLEAILSAKTILTAEQQKMIREYMEKGGHGFLGPHPRP